MWKESEQRLLVLLAGNSAASSDHTQRRKIHRIAFEGLDQWSRMGVPDDCHELDALPGDGGEDSPRIEPGAIVVQDHCATPVETGKHRPLPRRMHEWRCSE